MSRLPLSFSVLLCAVFTMFCGCSHAPYERTNVAYIAHSSDIKEADKNLELGRFCFKIFDYINSEKYSLKALDISVRAQYPEGAFSAYNNLGVLYTELKKYDAAWSNLSLASTVATKNNYKQQAAEVLNNLAFLFLESGQPKAGLTAGTLLEDALRHQPDLPLRLVIENNQGLFNLSKGDLVKALGLFKKVQETAESKNLYESEVLAKVHIGDVLNSQGYNEQSTLWFKKALDSANFWGFNRGKITALLKLGTVYERLKDWTRALLYYQAVQSLHRDLKASLYYSEDDLRINNVKKNTNS
jgi:tetratricopeptide (TPR) repeat protein